MREQDSDCGPDSIKRFIDNLSMYIRLTKLSKPAKTKKKYNVKHKVEQIE